MSLVWLSVAAARCYHALPPRLVSARAALGARPGVGPVVGGPECPDPSAGRVAVRPKPAPVGLDAGVAEPSCGPRAPTLQAGGALLGAPVAHARLADAALGARRPRPSGARWLGSDGGPDACGAGQRALRLLGGVHAGRGLARTGGASELGRAGLPGAA